MHVYAPDGRLIRRAHAAGDVGTVRLLHAFAGRHRFFLRIICDFIFVACFVRCLLIAPLLPLFLDEIVDSCTAKMKVSAIFALLLTAVYALPQGRGATEEEGCRILGWLHESVS